MPDYFSFVLQKKQKPDLTFYDPFKYCKHCSLQCGWEKQYNSINTLTDTRLKEIAMQDVNANEKSRCNSNIQYIRIHDLNKQDTTKFLNFPCFF